MARVPGPSPARRGRLTLERLEDRIVPSDGVLDPSFGTGGVVVGPDANTPFKDVAVQSDGKIVAAGDTSVVRYLPGGVLDPGFGTGGVLALPSGGLSNVQQLAPQPDGKILVTSFGDGFNLARLTDTGALDTSFGEGGFVRTGLSQRDTVPSKMAVQPDGKIVVVGTAQTPHGDGVAVARFTPDGSLDSTFGNGGTVVTSFFVDNGLFFQPPDESWASCLALQADGGVIVGGSRFSGVLTSGIVLRYTAGGTLDPAFGDGGKVSLAVGGCTSLAIQSDNRILVAAEASAAIHPASQPPSPTLIPIKRLNPDGSPDETFQKNIPLGPGVVTDLAALADGKIVFTAAGGLLAGRLEADGGLDPTFGSGGLASFPPGASPFDTRAVAVQPDGGIVVAGQVGTAPSSRDGLARATGTSPAVQIFPVNTGDLFVTGTDAGGGPNVLAFAAAGGDVKFNFFAFARDFPGGVRVAAGDVTGDGVPDLIAVPGPGGAPDVHVYDGTTGALRRQFFAFGAEFFGGLYVASGDVNGDGFADVVVGADAGGGANVAVFDGQSIANGQPILPLVDFFPYGQAFTGGVRVGLGDVDGDGHADLICGAGPGGGPNVSVISGADGQTLLASFFPYAPTFTGGVYVAAGDVNGDARADLICGTGAGGGPNVAVVSGADFRTLLASFFAYGQGFTGGVRVGAADRNGDGRAEILCVPGPGGGPDVRSVGGVTGQQLDDFFAYGLNFAAGLYVAGSAG